MGAISPQSKNYRDYIILTQRGCYARVNARTKMAVHDTRAYIHGSTYVRMRGCETSLGSVRTRNGADTKRRRATVYATLPLTNMAEYAPNDICAQARNVRDEEHK